MRIISGVRRSDGVRKPSMQLFLARVGMKVEAVVVVMVVVQHF